MGMVIPGLVLLLLWPSTARSNGIMPPVIVVWPAAWILLVPVVFIEAGFAVRMLELSAGAGFRLSWCANLLSTALGVPLATCFNPLPVIFLRSGEGETSSLALGLLFLASLLLPLHLLSVLSEACVARRLVDVSRRRRVWRWAWLANSVTYALISAGLLALVVIDWANRRGINP